MCNGLLSSQTSKRIGCFEQSTCTGKEDSGSVFRTSNSVPQRVIESDADGCSCGHQQLKNVKQGAMLEFLRYAFSVIIASTTQSALRSDGTTEYHILVSYFII